MIELRLLCPQDRVESLSDALNALDALSVSVEDADAHTDLKNVRADEGLNAAPDLVVEAVGRRERLEARKRGHLSAPRSLNSMRKYAGARRQAEAFDAPSMRGS